MNDIELLELAAKAAGAEVSGYRGNVPRYGMPMEDDDGGTSYNNWNPLEDDGDAFRLAVMLGISNRNPVRIGIEYQDDVDPDYTVVEISGHGETIHYHSNGPFCATRYAIVRAAAEIGRSMS